MIQEPVHLEQTLGWSGLALGVLALPAEAVHKLPVLLRTPDSQDSFVMHAPVVPYRHFISWGQGREVGEWKERLKQSRGTPLKELRKKWFPIQCVCVCVGGARASNPNSRLSPCTTVFLMGRLATPQISGSHIFFVVVGLFVLRQFHCAAM